MMSMRYQNDKCVYMGSLTHLGGEPQKILQQCITILLKIIILE